MNFTITTGAVVICSTGTAALKKGFLLHLMLILNFSNLQYHLHKLKLLIDPSVFKTFDAAILHQFFENRLVQLLKRLFEKYLCNLCNCYNIAPAVPAGKFIVNESTTCIYKKSFTIYCCKSVLVLILPVCQSTVPVLPNPV